jgi:hypothetical protein
MALLRTEATAIVKRNLLPALPNNYQEQPTHFSQEDIANIIQQIVAKGGRYALLRKGLNADETISLPLRLQNSNFVVPIY